MSGPLDQALRQRAQAVMPAGVHGHLSVARRSPRTPQFISRAEGAYITDVDGNRYLDFMCGFGTNLLGYAHPDIDRAYVAQLAKVDTATAPSPLSVELAEAYTKQIAHADWVMFCKNGSDATSTALLAVRAHRGRSKVLIAQGAYHGASTWSTPGPAGSLPAEREHFIPFNFNDIDSFSAAVNRAGDDLAGIFASPFRHDLGIAQELPTLEFATAVRETCDRHDALLVLDDVRAGFRLARESSWHHLGVEPDISCWGKSLANGHSLSATMGNDRAREAASKIYVTGSFWHAAAPLAAGIETLRIITNTDYLEHMTALGGQLRSGLDRAAADVGINLSQTGPVQMPLIMVTNDDGSTNGRATHRFVDHMLDQGIYFHPNHNMFLNAAMTAEDIATTVSAGATALTAVVAHEADGSEP